MRSVAVMLLVASGIAAADTRAVATRREGAVTLDGTLDDPAWQHAVIQRGFIRRFPSQGGHPDDDTRFAVIYDSRALYIAVWADDRFPAKIQPALTRRDAETASDTITIAIGSRDDHLTAYVFELSSAGVQRDLLAYDDTQTDVSWDAVWRSEVAIGATGWTAEVEIPFSQLRYSSAGESWGLQVLRTEGRTGEESSWASWPRDSERFVSSFGRLDGLRRLPAERRLELLPYASAGIEHASAALDPTRAIGNAGLDAKWGIGSSFTLAATINPDFGQVEADPSQINLTAGELFFPEKRPFFVEGVELFQVLIGSSSNNVEGPFYSRRIGAAPTGNDGTYVDAPTDTTIYGAAKLTGKTAGGWSVGLLDAVTARETATAEDGTQQVIAPLTNYAVGRIKRDLREGKTSIGLFATAVDRDLDAQTAPLLHDHAVTATAQLSHRWGRHLLDLQLLTSEVHGSAAAIERTQRDPRHFFQRPDRFLLDPTITHMEGYGLTWIIGAPDQGRFRYGFGGDLRSTGLELNDAGFLRQAGRVVPYIYAEYHHDKPSETLLEWKTSLSIYAVDHLGDDVFDELGVQLETSAQLVNFWTFALSLESTFARWEPSALRGGPALRNDFRYPGSLSVDTDGRKNLRAHVDFSVSRTPASDSIESSLTFGLTARVSSRLELFAGPSWASTDLATQYVAEAVDTGGRTHFVLARIRETTAGMTLRVDWALSRHLSLQAYAQPFIASGRYSQYKDVIDPRAEQFDRRFATPTLHLTDGVFTATRSGTFQFARPDFNVRELNSIVVARWEYRPGSTIFAIWSHGRSSFDTDGRLRPGHDLGALFDAPADNLVMVKANYWFGL